MSVKIINHCQWKNCKKHSEFIIWFSKILQCDNSGFECSGDKDYTQCFCEKHFGELGGCGNVIEYRKIGDVKWISADDKYSIYYYLKYVYDVKDKETVSFE